LFPEAIIIDIPLWTQQSFNGQRENRALVVEGLRKVCQILEETLDVVK